LIPTVQSRPSRPTSRWRSWSSELGIHALRDVSPKSRIDARRRLTVLTACYGGGGGTAPPHPPGGGWGTGSATDNTLKAGREKSIWVADHRGSVLDCVPVRAVGIRHPVAVRERDLRSHTAARTVTGLHVGHVRVRSGVGMAGAADNTAAVVASLSLRVSGARRLLRVNATSVDSGIVRRRRPGVRAIGKLLAGRSKDESAQR